jgi:aspartyl-tRNA(Asn)/glutamyl-tRNA(Gln) amidotransferase subunit C
MSALSRDDVAHVASLARIDLTDAELDRLAGQLDQIVGWVQQVSEVAATDVAAMSHPLPLVNVTRSDEVRASLSAQSALAGAPAAEDQRFSVPRILDEE